MRSEDTYTPATTLISFGIRIWNEPAGSPVGLNLDTIALIVLLVAKHDLEVSSVGEVCGCGEEEEETRELHGLVMRYFSCRMSIDFLELIYVYSKCLGLLKKQIAANRDTYSMLHFLVCLVSLAVLARR